MIKGLVELGPYLFPANIFKQRNWGAYKIVLTQFALDHLSDLLLDALACLLGVLVVVWTHAGETINSFGRATQAWAGGEDVLATPFFFRVFLSEHDWEQIGCKVPYA